VKKYMANYGIENVRGGSYSQIHLDESSVFILKKEIASAFDLCLNYGKKGHFIKDCKESSSIIAQPQYSLQTTPPRNMTLIPNNNMPIHLNVISTHYTNM
jgi:hypothetical protein